MRQIAISDIHGCHKTFLALLDQLSLSHADTLYLLGDYVDRGPDSKAVIDTIWSLQAEGYAIECLMGNHESMTVDEYDETALTGRRQESDPALLLSFEAENILEIPKPYIKWMRHLKRYLEIPGYVLVHAGLNFKYPDPFMDEEALIWIRNWRHSVNRDWLGDRLIVHGHTPITRPDIEIQARQYHISPVQDIDCGAVFVHARNMGHLCAFDLSNRQFLFQRNIEPLFVP